MSAPAATYAQSGWTTENGNARQTRVSAFAGPIQPEEQWTHDVGSFAFHPLVSSQGTTFYSSTNAVRAVDANGNVVWTHTTDQYFGSPALSDDEEILYQASRTGMVYAIEASTGDEIWALAAAGPSDIMSIEAVGPDKAVYSRINGGHLIVANPDGTLRWSYGVGRSVGNVAIAGDGTLRVNDDGDLVALSAAGSELWRVQREAMLDLPAGSPSIRPDGSTILCSAQMVASVSPAGALDWVTFQECSSGALLDDGFIAAHRNGMEAYDFDGNQQWSVSTQLVRDFVAVDANGIVYRADYESGILAYNREGVFLWSLQSDPPVWSVVPAPDNRLVSVIYNSSTFEGAIVSMDNAPGNHALTDVSRSLVYLNPASQAETAEASVSVRNIGTATVSVENPIVGGADPGAFAISGSGGSLAPGESLVFDVSFAAPNAQPYFSAELVVETNGLSGTHRVELLGSVGTPILAKGGWPTPFHDQRWSASSEYQAPGVDASVVWQYCDGVDQVFSGLVTTPVSRADGSVYVLGNAVNLYHLSRGGSLLGRIDGGSASILRTDGTILNGNRPTRASTPLNNTLWSRYGNRTNQDFVPAIAPDGTWYYVSGSNLNAPQLNAVSPGGDVLWARDLDSYNTSGQAGVLLANDGTVVFVAERLATAFDPSGTELWTSILPGNRRSAMTADGVLVVATNTAIFGLDVETGATVWSLEGLENTSTGDIAIAPDGTIISGRHILNADGTLRSSPFNVSTPVTVSADNIILRAAGSGVQAFDIDGNLVWSVSGVGGEVTLADNGLAYLRGGCLTAIGSSSAQQPAINLSTSNLDFGTVEPSQSVQQSVTVTNTGSATADVSSLDITGVNASDFTITTPSAPFPITAQNAVDVTIAFSSDSDGSKSAILEITSNAPGSPHQVSLAAEVGSVQQNNAPVAVDDEATVDEDNSITIAVLDNDTDADGQTLNVAEVFQPGNGTVALVDGTTITYTPDPDYFGADVFRYIATDGIATSDTASVIVTVNPINDAPVAVDDAIFTARNTPVDFDPRANDFDVDDTVLQITDIGATSVGGTVEISGDGLTYTPPADFTGTDRFDYTISDPQDATATAEVVVNVDIAQFAHTGITAVGVSGVATAVSNNGVVVGAARMPDGTIQAWKYDDGVQQLLNLQGASQSIAYDINDANQIVGFALGADSIGRAFVHEPSGATMFYQQQNSKLSVAYGINASGRVVGQVTPEAGGPEARIFAPQFQNGHPPEAAGSEFFAINEDDIAVGVAYRADGTSVPLIDGQLLSSPGRMYDASLDAGVGSLFDGSSSIATVWDGDLNVTNPFGTTGFSEAYAINDAGWIVGTNQSAASAKREGGDNDECGMRNDGSRGTCRVERGTWGATGGLHSRTMEILNAATAKTSIDGLEATLLAGSSLRRLGDMTSAPGWTLVEARDINDFGDIVGWGTAGGVPQAFMLSASSNTPPSTRDDEVAAATEDVVTIRVLDNDDDADGDALRIVRVGSSTMGSARVSDDSSSIVYEAGPLEGTDTFTYTVTDGAGSSSTANVRVVVARGLSADRAQIVSRYPNPASSELAIVLNLIDNEAAAVEVFDLLGRVVRRVVLRDNSAGLRTIAIPTDRLAPGTYLIRFEHGGGIDTREFVVIR